MRQFLMAAVVLVGSANVARPADPPDSSPKWFKGNLHTHTLWSDGNDYPEMVVDYYANNGYHFLALSDHNVLSQGQRWMPKAEANRRAGRGNDGFARYVSRFGKDWVETRTNGDVEEVRLKPLGEFRTLFEVPGKFLLIQGEEITDSFERRPVHMNATNLLELIKPRGGSTIVETMANNLDAALEQGERLGRPILTHLNHPNFGYAITAEELAMVTKERFFEVYNGHPGVHHQGDETHASVERMWDVINTIRIGEMRIPPVYGLGTDDSHNYFGTQGSSPGRGWVMVRARFLTPEHVIHAMMAADFYASSGVALRDVRLNVESKSLGIVIEAEPDTTYVTHFVGTLKGYDATRRPVLDAAGKPLPVTQRYSDDVGKVLATVEGNEASYSLTGEELFVRAVVTSSKPPANPSFDGQKAQAWTQPFAWEKWMRVETPR
ncbi:MAG: PHP domain-containing protein [Isosphaeraceae bacterium]